MQATNLIASVPNDCFSIITLNIETNKDLSNLALCCKELYVRALCYGLPVRPHACSRFLTSHLNDSTRFASLTTLLANLSVCTLPIQLTLTHTAKGQAELLKTIGEKFFNIALTVHTDQILLCQNVKVLNLPRLSSQPEDKEAVLQQLETFAYPASVEELSFRSRWMSQKVLDQVTSLCPSLRRLSLYDCEMDSCATLFTRNYPTSMTELQFRQPRWGTDRAFERMLTEEAIQNLKQNPQLAPPSSFRYSLHGLRLLEALRDWSIPLSQQQIERCQKFLEAALQINPNDVTALTALGILLSDIRRQLVPRDETRAQTPLEHAVALNPEHPLALAGLAIVLSHTKEPKNHELAVKYFEKACTLSMDSLLFQWMSSIIFNEQENILVTTSLGHYLTNIEELTCKNVLAMNPKNLRLIFTKVRVAIDEGRRGNVQDAGVKEVREMFQANPNSLAVFTGPQLEHIAAKIGEPSLVSKRFFCHPATFFANYTENDSDMIYRVHKI